MAKTRLVTAIAAGVLIGGISTGVAWAGGPGGAVEDPADLYAAVGTGTFEDFSDGPGGLGGEAGFIGRGATAEEASAAVLAQCEAAGGVDCTVDEYTNDNLCIASVGSSSAGVVAGGAGVTVDDALQDAIAKAAANNTPLGPDAVVIVSDCP
jgi:hypothetical protein